MPSQRLHPVPLDLGWRDMPVAADLLRSKVAAVDLDAERDRRQPEAGGGFVEGHLADLALDARPLRENAVEERGAGLERQRLHGRVNRGIVEEELDGLGGGGVRHAVNVYPSVYVVNPPSALPRSLAS